MPEEDYSQNIVKEYAYWTWLVHTNQGYLGRSVIWCKRENAIDLMDATPEEREELFFALSEIKEVLEKTFQSDWINYAFLGNESRHLHGHIIPRYASERNFCDQTFLDKEYGHNWRTDKSITTSKEVLQTIKKQMQSNLQK
jgi:diadenosine tetraphosphate (Ap4A) HIT family hydrolase